jgi:ABC-type multidrug transport system fused ATPase/permease subunit
LKKEDKGSFERMNALNQFLSEHRSCMRRATELNQEKSGTKQNGAYSQPQFENKNPSHRAATDDFTIATRIFAAVRQLLSPIMRRTILEMFNSAPWRFLAPACLFCMGWMASQFLRGRSIGNLIDSLFKAHSEIKGDSNFANAPPALTALLFLPIMFAFLEWLFNVLWDFCIMKAKTALIVDGRTRYFRSLLAQPLEFHAGISSAELAARIISDSEAIDEAIVYAPCHLLRGVFTLIIAAYIISIDPWLFALGLVLRLPWLLQFVEYAITVVANYELLETNASNAAQAHANEVLASVVTVQACTAEDEETENFKNHLKNVARIAATGSVVACGLRNVENGLTLASEIIILAYGVSRVHSGQITFGVFMALKVHMEMFISQFNFFEKAYVVIKRASVQSSRMFHFQDIYASSVVSPETRTRSILHHRAASSFPATEAPIIEFSHVFFSYPALTQPDEARMPVVLSDVSFSVPRGSSTAILGASGSGKSSIGKLILQFYTPSSGTVYIHGVACRGYDSTRRARELVSWVDQASALLSYESNLKSHDRLL